MESQHGDITAILLAYGEGDESALSSLIAMVYGQLKRLAHQQLGRLHPGQTLSTTALVHEAYVKLGNLAQVPWQSRSHFFAIAARAMRLVIVDYARQRCARKRGAGLPHISLNQADIATANSVESVLLIDQALRTLAATHLRLVRVVECRFFAGLTEEETAVALGISARTVRRDWLSAKAWLREQMS
jgi:RNA polymerase sigma factor (TIGR02999 family)